MVRRLFGAKVLRETGASLRLGGITHEEGSKRKIPNASLLFSPELLIIRRFRLSCGILHDKSFKAGHRLEPSVHVLCCLLPYVWELNGRRLGGSPWQTMRGSPAKKAKLACGHVYHAL